MNWTGGNLSRHSRGNANKGLVQRKKAHFAKARFKLQDGSTICDEFIAPYLSQSPSGRSTNRPRTVGVPSYDRGSGTYRSSFHNEASFGEPIATAELSDLPSHGISTQPHSPALPKKRAFFSTSATAHNRRDPDYHLHEEPSLEIQKRRLLDGKDWLGLGPAKPMYLRFEKGEEKAGLGKRKRLLGKQTSRLQPLSDQYLLSNDGLASKSVSRDNEFQIKIGSQAFASSKATPVMPGAHITGTDPEDIEESVCAVFQTEGESLHNPRYKMRTVCEKPFHDEEYLSTFSGSDQDAAFKVKESRAQDRLHVYVEKSEEKSPYQLVRDNDESLALSSVFYPSEPVTNNCSTEQDLVVESPLASTMRDLDHIIPHVSKSGSRSSSPHGNRRHVPRSNMPCATADGAGQGSGDQRVVHGDDTQWKHLLGLVSGGTEHYESDQQDKDYSEYQRQNMPYSTWSERVQPILSQNLSATTPDPLSEVSNAHFDCSTSFIGEPLPNVRTNKPALLVHDRVQSKGDVEPSLKVKTDESNLNTLHLGDAMDDVWKKFIFGGSGERSPMENDSEAENTTAASTSLPAMLRQESMTLVYDTTTSNSGYCKSEHTLDSMGMTFESLSATAGDTDIPSLKWQPRMHGRG